MLGSHIDTVVNAGALDGTYGVLAAEIVRRACGKTLGTVFRDDIAAPLRADFHIGLPEVQDSRVAELLAPKNPIDASTMDLPESTVTGSER